MNQKPTSQQRTSFLITLLGCLLLCAIPIAIAFFIFRSIRKFSRRLTGQESGGTDTHAALAQAKKRARKAKAAYDAANRKYVRASAKLAKAQAALETMQGSARTPAPDDDAEPKGTSSKQFWLGIGKALVKYLIARQMKKLA